MRARAVFKVWLVFAAIIAFGSLYPFDFAGDAVDWPTFWATCCGRPGRGDLLGNVVLFAPYGFLGMLATPEGRPSIFQLGVVVVGGLLLAFVLQLAQLYLPVRDPNVQDVAWNLAGILVGALAALGGRRWFSGSVDEPPADTVALLLIGAWIAYRLVPFVPSVDWQLIKDSVKPLFVSPVIDVRPVLHDVAAWLAVALLLRLAWPERSRDLALPLLVLGVFGLEIIIVDNALGLSNVLGASLALVAWFALLRYMSFTVPIVIALLVATILVQGLVPSDPAGPRQAFQWLPFSGLLGGSMYHNVLSISEKVFFYGSLVYLLSWTRLSLLWGALVAAIGVGVVELAQTRLPGHTPETTDPLLVLMAAWLVVALRRERPLSDVSSLADDAFPAPDPKLPGDDTGTSRIGRSRAHRRRRQRAVLAAVDGTTQAAARESSSNDAPSGADGTGSQPEQIGTVSAAGDSTVKQTINLRLRQVRALKRLARKARTTPSVIATRIVDAYMQGHRNPEKTPTLDTSLRREARKRLATIEFGKPRKRRIWTRFVIELRPDQVDYLERVCRAQNLSLSRGTRRILERYLD